MPDYADNYTARYKMRYFCGGMGHTQTWRIGSALTVAAAAAAIDSIQDVWLNIGLLMSSDLAFLDATFYPMGSDVALPAPLPFDMASVVNSGTLDPSAGPKYLSVPWLTGVGGKQTTFFYGTIADPDEAGAADYRFVKGENAIIDGLIASLASTITVMTGNDRQAGLAVKQYANFGVNPALVRRRRRG